jgi:hypothetical protein
MKFSARQWLIAVSAIALALTLSLIFVAHLYTPFTYYLAFIAGIFFGIVPADVELEGAALLALSR